jgi:hypothetical protein
LPVDTVYFNIGSSLSEIIHTVYEFAGRSSSTDVDYHYKLNFIDSATGWKYDGIIISKGKMKKTDQVSHEYIHASKVYYETDRLFFKSNKNMKIGIIISVYMRYYGGFSISGFPRDFNTTFESSFFKIN